MPGFHVERFRFQGCVCARARGGSERRSKHCRNCEIATHPALPAQNAINAPLVRAAAQAFHQMERMFRCLDVWSAAVPAGRARMCP